jgi:hypothetical protein
VSSGPSLPVPMSLQLLAILGRSIAADGEENTPGPHLGSVDDKSTSPRQALCAQKKLQENPLYRE